MDLLKFLATNDEEEQAVLERNVKDQLLNYHQGSKVIALNIGVREGKYNLTTKARRKNVGRNK